MMSQDYSSASSLEIMMYWIGFLLLGVGAVTAGGAPEYYQSASLFKQEQTLLLERLPHEDRNFDSAEARQNYAFGVLSTTLGYVAYDLVNNSKADVLSDVKSAIPLAWEDYNSYAKQARDLLKEFLTRMTTLVRMVDNICTGNDLKKCNALVDKEVKKDKHLQKQADLLLNLGEASKLIQGLLNKFDSLRENFEVVPYLYNNIQSKQIQQLLEKFKVSYIALVKVRQP